MFDEPLPLFDEPLTRFVGALTLSVVLLVAMMMLVLSAQVAVAGHLLPALGIGGTYNKVETLRAEYQGVYPQYNSPYTNTPTCDDRPMLVFNLSSATLQGYEIRKDIKVPFLTDRWLTVRSQHFTQGGVTPEIRADKLKVFTTQAQLGFMSLNDVELSEATQTGRNVKFGPDSTWFSLTAGKDVSGGVYAENITMWVQAMVANRLVFDRNGHPDPVALNMSLSTTDELQTFYSDKVGYAFPPGNNVNVSVNRSADRGGLSHNDSERWYFECQAPPI